MFDVKLFVGNYLQEKYPRPTITVMEGCCRKCLRGTPAGYNIKKKTFKDLMDDGDIDPYQLASAFHIGSAYQPPYFKDIVINMKSEAKPCKYPGNCNLKCVLCFSLIVNSDDVELDIWQGFKVHKACTSLCLHPCCSQRLPTLPAYLSLQRSTLMCNAHKGSDAFHKLTISTPETKRPLYPPPRPTRLPQPLPEPRIVPPEPAAKKTHSFKKQPKAKADKFDERGRSVNILNFFQSPASSHAKKQEGALKASKRDDAPRRFIFDKETGVEYGYWKGDTAYRLDTDAFLWKRTPFSPSSNIVYDFTPPISLATTSVPQVEEEQDKGGSSP